MVVVDGETKVAQYGQWDGYPEGQGAKILNFLKTCDLESFKNKVKACKALSKEDVKKINALNYEEWTKNYPQLSRDHGGAILKIINESPDGLDLFLNLSFAGNFLFCEWCYVIDFDKGTLEVYTGINKSLLAEGDRFFSLQENGHDEDRYYPVRMIHSFPLYSLPNEDDFLRILEEKIQRTDHQP